MSKISNKRHQNDVDCHEYTVDVALVSHLLTYFASCSTVSCVNFKLVNVATTILFLFIQKMVVQSQNYL